MADLNGKWIGSLLFGPEYGRDAGKELFFEIDFVQTGEKFTGTARDTGGFGASPDPAKIEGTFKENKIQFEKYYASQHTVDEHGKTIVDRSKSGPGIQYEGVYNESDKTFTGTWYIAMMQNTGRGMQEFKCTGTWNMKQNVVAKAPVV